MPRGERGGKKTARSKELAEATVKGQHKPKTEPSSETSRKRLEVIQSRVALEVAQSKASASTSVPVVEGPEFVDSANTPLLTAPVPKSLGKPQPAPSRTSSSAVEPSSSSGLTVGSSQSLASLVPVPKSVFPKESSVLVQGKKRPVEVEEVGRPKANSILTIGQSLRECRISIDYNHVLNVRYAGDREFQGIHPENIRLLRSFIEENKDRGFRVGVTSYIGTSGPNSQDRRNNLEEQVRTFNRNQPDRLSKLGVRILGTRKKGEFLNSTGCVVHIDDKLECLDSCSKEIVTFWVSNARYHRRHRVVSSVGQALEQIQQGRFEASAQARSFESCWDVL